MDTVMYHLTTNIAGLMRNYNDKKLGDFFNMPGKKARIELQALLNKGDRLLPSEGCKHFDTQKGCQCRFYDSEGKKLNNLS